MIVLKNADSVANQESHSFARLQDGAWEVKVEAFK
jgi:hypothetical protein